jgi:hypothetical protein
VGFDEFAGVADGKVEEALDCGVGFIEGAVAGLGVVKQEWVVALFKADVGVEVTFP